MKKKPQMGKLWLHVAIIISSCKSQNWKFNIGLQFIVAILSYLASETFAAL